MKKRAAQRTGRPLGGFRSHATTPGLRSGRPSWPTAGREARPAVAQLRPQQGQDPRRQTPPCTPTAPPRGYWQTPSVRFPPRVRPAAPGRWSRCEAAEGASRRRAESEEKQTKSKPEAAVGRPALRRYAPLAALMGGCGLRSRARRRQEAGAVPRHPPRPASGRRLKPFRIAILPAVRPRQAGVGQPDPPQRRDGGSHRRHGRGHLAAHMPLQPAPPSAYAERPCPFHVGPILFTSAPTPQHHTTAAAEPLSPPLRSTPRHEQEYQQPSTTTAPCRKAACHGGVGAFERTGHRRPGWHAACGPGN
jgi:hypothetical protein